MLSLIWDHDGSRSLVGDTYFTRISGSSLTMRRNELLSRLRSSRVARIAFSAGRIIFPGPDHLQELPDLFHPAFRRVVIRKRGNRLKAEVLAAQFPDLDKRPVQEPAQEQSGQSEKEALCPEREHKRDDGERENGAGQTDNNQLSPAVGREGLIHPLTNDQVVHRRPRLA